MRIAAIMTSVGLALMFLSRIILGAGGDLVWKTEFDRVGRNDEARAMAAEGERVFVAGYASNNVDASPRDFLVLAYDAETGALLWTDIFDKAGDNDQALAISARGGRVFAAGQSVDGPVIARHENFLVRTYDAETGMLLWQDEFDGAGQSDRASAITILGSWVFAAGKVGVATGNTDVLVHAYDAETGVLRWSSQGDVFGGVDEAFAIAAWGGGIFIAGRARDTSGNRYFLVQAYDAKTGAQLWEDVFEEIGIADRAEAITALGGRVFAAGRGDDDFLVRAYDAKSGALLWQDQVDRGGIESARAISAWGGRVFTETRAYNAKSGALVWDLGVLGRALGLVAQAGKLFSSPIQVRDAKTGSLLWTPEPSFCRKFAIVVKGNRLFAAGVSGFNPAFDVCVEAYEVSGSD